MMMIVNGDDDDWSIDLLYGYPLESFFHQVNTTEFDPIQ